MKKRLTLRLSVNDYERLQQLKEKSGYTMATLIKNAIRKMLKERGL